MQIPFAGIIVARLSSTRIPAKNILPINGIPMIIRLIERLKSSSQLDQIIVCTSDDSTDDPLEKLCREQNILIGRGPLDNVMERICSVCESYDVKNIVEILGDNPFIESRIVDDAIQIYKSYKYDYVANYSNDYPFHKKIKKFPVGVRAQVYSLLKAKEHSRTDLLRQSHPSSFLYLNPEIYKIKLFGAEGEYADLAGYQKINLSINYPKNLEFAKYIFSKYCNSVSLSSILRELKLKPNLMNLIEQHE